MFCIGVSYKKTPAGIRQKFAFSKEEQCQFIGNLIKDNIITGGMVVSTCNRSEIYFSGTGTSAEEVTKELAIYKNLDGGDIKKYCLFYGGQGAVKHLFNVTCGLDSMVLGEDEILRQVKEAYLTAVEKKYINGELNIIFQDALNCAKTGKSRTRLSSTPVSVATITANTIEKYMYENNLSGGKVMVIGITGKTGSVVAKDLLSKGIHIIGTSRKHKTDSLLYWHDKEMAEIISFEERYLYINQVCAVVSATISPHYTLTYTEYLKYVKDGSSMLFIDLAVPYDIDRTLSGLSGIKLLDIDFFNTLSRENANIKLSELGKAEEILAECVENTMKKIYIRSFISKIQKDRILYNKFQKDKSFSHMVYYLKDLLNSSELKDVLGRIYNKEVNGGK